MPDPAELRCFNAAEASDCDLQSGRKQRERCEFSKLATFPASVAAIAECKLCILKAEVPARRDRVTTASQQWDSNMKLN